MRTALEMANVGDYMISFDLKAGYHHVEIHRDHWQYLGFSWGNGESKKYYISRYCLLVYQLLVMYSLK